MKQTITHHLKKTFSNQHIQNRQRWPPISTDTTTKSGNDKHDQLQRANHENIKKRWRTIENTTRYQSEPIGYVINVSKKTFTKAKFQLLNKILISYPHLKCIININSMKN